MSQSIAVCLAGLFVGGFLVLLLLQQSDGDPLVFAAVSAEEDFPRSFIESEMGRTIVTRPGLGHDGQPFFLQALDPLYRDARSLKVDNPIYRGQRVVYPLLVGLGGLVPLRLIPWGMVIVQIAAFGFGTWVTGEMAADNGQSRWWGLAFALNPGAWSALQIGGAGSLALAFGIAAVVVMNRRRFWGAALLLALSALTREVMLAMAVGLLVQEWRRSRVWRPEVVIIPAGLSVLWGLYLRLQIDETFPAAGGAIDFPFAGLVEAFGHWSETPSELAFGLCTMLAAIVVIAGAVLTKDLFASAAAPFAVLLPLLSIAVVRESFDYSRAVIPLYPAAVLLAAMNYDRLSSVAKSFRKRSL